MGGRALSRCRLLEVVIFGELVLLVEEVRRAWLRQMRWKEAAARPRWRA